MKIERMTLSSNEKIALLSNMTTMLSAGIPILETVDSLLSDAKKNQKKLLETLKADLMQGQRIYSTFAKFPRIFDKVTVNILKASEEAGTLDVTLKDLKENIQHEQEFSDKIRSALIYPIFIVGVFFAVLIMILVVVVPKISSVFLRLRVTLPLPTKILIAMSRILLTYTLPVVLGIIILIILTILLFKNYKKEILNLLFKVPIISKLAVEIDLTRLTRSLGLLLNAGLTITSALELSEEIVLKKEIARALKHTREMVIAGNKLTEGLKQHKNLFPIMMIRIVEVGEKTGSLDKSLQDVSEFLNYQVEGTLKTLTALLEPVMLVVVGGLIGGMMLAIIAPVYSLIGQIGNH